MSWSVPDKPHPADSGPKGKAALSTLERMRLAKIVAQAVAEDRVLFYFQPVVRRDARHFVAFYEMLCRIRLSDGTVLPAGQFMQAVEGHPLAKAIDVLALDWARMALERDPTLRLSVNLAPDSIEDGAWGAAFDRLAAAGVADRLILELTEVSSLGDIAGVRAFLERVRRAGASVGIDDFGAGCTSMRYFREFRFDMVKIDGAFVQGVAADADARVMVRAMVDIAHHFDMLVVAERVEVEEDAAMLAALGVDAFQGYLIGRPAAVPTLPGAALHATAG